MGLDRKRPVSSVAPEGLTFDLAVRPSQAPVPIRFEC
jgi:hypothetical protein